MNFLELVKRAWTEASQSGDGPASVVGMSGHQLKFVNWVRDSWVKIQKESSQWAFLKAIKTCALTAGQETFTSADLDLMDLKKPLTVSILCDGQWSPIRLIVSEQSSDTQYNKQPGRPCIAYFSAGTFSFDTIPDAAYQLKIQYVKRSQNLLENADTPQCDEEYHLTIMWHAVRAYAIDDGDNALYQRANNEYEFALSEMKSDLLPKISFGPSAFR